MSTRARTRRRSGRLALLVPLAVAGLVAGCAPDPTPAPTPSALSPSVTPTSLLPTPAPSPTQPAELSRDDETGAIAAARFFLTDLYRYTVSTQDTGPWTTASLDRCTFCASVKNAVASQVAGKTVTYPGLITVLAERVASASPLAYEIDFDVQQEAGVTWSTAGTVVSTEPARAMTIAYMVVRHPEGWRIWGVDTLTVNGAPK